MPLTDQDILDQLRKVNDPELHRDLVTLNMVKQATCKDGHVQIEIELTTPACPMKDRIRADIEQAVQAAEDDEGVEGVEGVEGESA